MPKLSIIIPCCNQGKYFERIVESIFKQIYQDFEIIIVTNESNDDFIYTLLCNFDRQKVKIIHTEGQGLDSAIDDGIKNAGGKYILPLHIDDTIENEYLEKTAKMLDINFREYHSLIEEKNTHIRNIESELNRIKQSNVWRLAEIFRRIFYIKILGKIPSLQRSVINIRKEGIGKFLGKKTLIKIGLLESEYDKWLKKNELSDEKREVIRREVACFQYRPKISIIMPVYNVDEAWIKKAIESVLHQLYENWDLCIADDGSTLSHVKKILSRYENKDKRIIVKYLSDNRGIASASNEALSLATGEFIGLMDNDDELSPDALYEVVKALNEQNEIDFIYSDEDKITGKGVRKDPFFKPDWSPDMFLSYNYMCHFSVIRRKIVEAIGGFREGFEGSQDYDLFLRVVEKTQRIAHIPKILYHWRSIEGSIGKSAEAKMYAYEGAKRSLNEYIQRIGSVGDVFDGYWIGTYHIKYKINDYPHVSIIIPTKEKCEVLMRCIDSIVNHTSYTNYSVIVVDNGSSKKETLAYYDNLKRNGKISVIEYNRPFNFSAINNYAVGTTDSEYLIFLNNDTEVISDGWIEEMLGIAQRKNVGAIGALLYYPNDTIQHGGIIVGLGGVAGHPHKYMTRDSLGYFCRLKVIQNFSAVTGACMMTKKSLFDDVGGFDENMSHAFNDVDYCLRLREKGYLIVYTPYAELYHYESMSRGYEDTPEKEVRFKKEQKYFYRKWGSIMAAGDPYYNPNLNLEREDFSIHI